MNDFFAMACTWCIKKEDKINKSLPVLYNDVYYEDVL